MNKISKNSNFSGGNTWRNNPEKIILFDNGAYEIKHCTASGKKYKRFHNAKFFEKLNNATNNYAPYYVDDIKEDFAIENISTIGKSFNRPLSRGLLYDVDLQLDIWERILSTHYSMEVGDDTFNENLFMFTHTPMAPDEVIEGYFQVIFEYFGFEACFKAIPHVFSAFYAKEKYEDEINPTVQLVIDSGFSSTTIVPILDNMPIYNAIKRVEIGGKLLTNYLKECLINTIELDLRKEFFLSNLIKEESCFVTKNFEIDMKISSLKDENNINKKLFILPEYRKRNEEYMRKIPVEKYSIELNNLRFIVPELIFNPNLIGLEEGGVQDGVMQSVNECHRDYTNLLIENIITVGGNTKFSNFKERLKTELTPLVDHDYVKEIKIFDLHSDPKTEPVIEGMKSFARNIDMLKDLAIYKQEYSEIGFNVVWKTCY